MGEGGQGVRREGGLIVGSSTFRFGFAPPGGCRPIVIETSKPGSGHWKFQLFVGA
jgi:hypothetical protein